MAGFGDRLKRERESSDTPLADVARRTKIGIQYLEALERGDFDGLPGRRGFGKLYIRVYAELFGFDPGPVISEYDQQRLEHELLNDADSRVEPERPRKARFVPPARTSPSTEREAQAPSSPAETPEPDTALMPTQMTDPVVPSIDPPAAGPASSAAAALGVFSVLSQPDLFPHPDPTERSAPSVARTMTGGFPSWKRSIAGGAVVLAVLAALGVTLKLRTSRPVDLSAEPPSETGTLTPPATPRSEANDARIGEGAGGHPGVRAPRATAQVEPMAPVPHDAPRVPMAQAVVTPRSPDLRHLEVSDFELGTGVVDHRVVNVRRDFDQGTVASFLTRVRGGEPGQAIHHAWIREGRPVQRIELRLGSLDWRTYSTKTLWGAGEWAVEAQDEHGRVLARIEFRCRPAGGVGSGR